MNRIILIGNGFDLAHNLPTSYNHFLGNLWKTFIKEVQKKSGGYMFENDDIIVNNIPQNWKSGYSYSNFISTLKEQDSSLIFKNKFLQIISNTTYLHNWVDIENEYYNLLKRSYSNATKRYEISQLNLDFNNIKKYLLSYLKEIEQKFYIKNRDQKLINSIGYKIYANFRLRDFSEKTISAKTKHEFDKIKDDLIALDEDKITMYEIDEKKRFLISRVDDQTDIKKILLSNSADAYFDLVPNHILFLNFNYTSTEQLYSKVGLNDLFEINEKTSIKINHIHGEIRNNDSSSIIFGFGDEIDKDYNEIERLNDNRYLENIKSINYLETDRYKKLLEFVNKGLYQIFIFGHSCGISDRTLLNTLFEHENCVSIKPFYHKINETKDNYSDIVRNISRNFNDKVKMRDKVVNKEYCEPLS